jgi:hypothetical protein
VRNVGSADFDDVGLREAIDAGYVPGRAWSPPLRDRRDGRPLRLHLLPAVDGREEPLQYRQPRRGPQGGAHAEEVRRPGDQDLRDGRGTLATATRAGPAAADSGRDDRRRRRSAHGRHEGRRSRPWRGGINTALRAGIDTIEHASLVDDEAFQAGGQHGTYFSMDIYDDDYIPAEGKKNGVLEDNLRKDRTSARSSAQNFKKAPEAGVKMIFGTDGGVYPNGDNALQFAVMVRYGATPLRRSRRRPSRRRRGPGQGKDVGQIAVGRYGDLIAVDGDPTSDVRLLEHVAFVMKGGAVVKAAP